jgi:hypothetical protein
VSVPPVAKLTLTFVAGWSVPLPDTVDCTTPSATVITRLAAAVGDDAAPTDVTATTIAATHSAPRKTLSSGRLLVLDICPSIVRAG